MAAPLSRLSRSTPDSAPIGPQLLPDGRTVLFTLAQTASWDEAQIVVQSLDGGARQTLITGGTDARYLPTGHLVYALRETVLAVPFDAASLSIKGGPVPLIEGVAGQGAASQRGRSFCGVARVGRWCTCRLSMSRRATDVGVGRSPGREEAIAAPPRPYIYPRLAPDGTGLALDIPDDLIGTSGCGTSRAGR